MTETNKAGKAFDAPQVHFIKKNQKPDTKLVVTSDPLIFEDEFSSLYFSARKNSNVVIEPPFNPLVLASLITRNNVLQQCITAMEVNIDGTGHEFELLEAEQDKETGDLLTNTDTTKTTTTGSTTVSDAPSPPINPNAPSPVKTTKISKKDDITKDVGGVDKEKEMLEHFFNEPFPGESFTTIRRKLRVDLEATGNGYLEAIRNLAGELVFVRHLESVMLRLVKLDAPTNVDTTITRGGKEVTATIPMRERRFCYKVGANLVFYREFGTSRQINKKTGAWIENDVKDTDTSLLGSEIIHFRLNKDFRTNYGLPRWINQLPSVLGSRKAEEYNLEFFDSGGMPPAIIFVQGGALVGGVREQLQSYLSGKASQKHRAAIVEVMSTSGSLDNAGSVQVKTERFGSSATDFMFQKYDDQTKEHVRMSFRLAPIFIGSAESYNYASAIASLKACESQVFQPERFEFDEKINNTLMKALGAKTYRFRSKGVTFADSLTQIQGMLYASKVLGGKEVIDTLNEITGLKMEYDESKDPAQQQQQGGTGGSDPAQGGQGEPLEASQSSTTTSNNSPSQSNPYQPPPMGTDDLGQPPPTGANAMY